MNCEGTAGAVSKGSGDCGRGTNQPRTRPGRPRPCAHCACTARGERSHCDLARGRPRGNRCRAGTRPDRLAPWPCRFRVAEPQRRGERRAGGSCHQRRHRVGATASSARKTRADAPRRRGVGDSRSQDIGSSEGTPRRAASRAPSPAKRRAPCGEGDPSVRPDRCEDGAAEEQPSDPVPSSGRCAVPLCPADRSERRVAARRRPLPLSSARPRRRATAGPGRTLTNDRS